MHTEFMIGHFWSYDGHDRQRTVLKNDHENNVGTSYFGPCTVT